MTSPSEYRPLTDSMSEVLEGEPAEIDVVGEPELIGQVVVEAIAVDVEFAPEAPRAEPRFDCLGELIGDILAIRKSRLIEPVVEPVREHAGDGMRQVAGGQSLVRLDLIRVDEAIGPRKRGVREQFAADARGIVVLPVFGPVVEVDIPSFRMAFIMSCRLNRLPTASASIAAASPAPSRFTTSS